MQQIEREDLQRRATGTAAALLDEARARGIVVSADGRVGEADAARLIGMAPESLRNARSEGTAPPHYKVSIAGARISYRLADVAVWLEKFRNP
ncbi:MAG: hypothetical protein LC121_25030 [Anaerolineae bacterium]|nr:hypothetical protein [Anaerolineae bacterium]